MGVESATYISQLNASFPDGAVDPKSQGDNHLRLIKAVLQATFPNAQGQTLVIHRGTTAPSTKTTGLIIWIDSSTATAVQWKYWTGTLWVTLPIQIDETNERITIFPFESTLSTTAVGPSLDLYRNITPAVNNNLAEIKFSSKNSTPTKINYARMAAVSNAVTAAAESGILNFYTYQAGAETLQMYLRRGLVVGGPSGSDIPLGVNTERLCINGYDIGRPYVAVTGSGASQIEFTTTNLINRTYLRGYRFELENIRFAANNEVLSLRFDVGAGYVTSGYSHGRSAVQTATPGEVGSDSASSIVLTAAVDNTISGRYIHGWVEVMDVGTGAGELIVRWGLDHMESSSGNHMYVHGSGRFNTGGTLSKIGFMSVTPSNISGTIRGFAIPK